MARKKSYNPEKRVWRGRSYNSGKGKGGPVKARRIPELREESAATADRRLDAKALVDAFDGMLDVFFPKEKPQAASPADARRAEHDQKLVGLAFRIASFWRRQRLDDHLTSRMEPFFRRLLDELERETRGDDRSCECLAFKESKGAYHDIQCPARKR